MRDLKFSRSRVWCSESSGIYCRFLNWMSTDASEVRTCCQHETIRSDIESPYDSAVRVQHASSYKHMSHTGHSKINVQGTQGAKLQVSHGANSDKLRSKTAKAVHHHHCTDPVPREGCMNIPSQRQKVNQLKTKKHTRKCFSRHSEVPH
jgi:hypothetical protein